jgi:hypothetical protein
MGDGRCSTTEVSSTNGSGMAYDFNNEYRDTNSDMESRERVNSVLEIRLSSTSTKHSRSVT